MSTITYHDCLPTRHGTLDAPPSFDDAPDKNTTRGGPPLNCDADTLAHIGIELRAMKANQQHTDWLLDKARETISRVGDELRAVTAQEKRAGFLLVKAHDTISEMLGVFAGRGVPLDDGPTRGLLHEIEEVYPWIATDSSSGCAVTAASCSTTGAGECGACAEATTKHPSSSGDAFDTAWQQACGG